MTMHDSQAVVHTQNVITNNSETDSPSPIFISNGDKGFSIRWNTNTNFCTNNIVC